MRISIRSLMLLIVVLMIPLAGFYNRYSGKRQVERFAETLKGNCRWSHQMDGWYDYMSPSQNQYEGPEWIRKWLGDDAFSYIERLRIDAKTEGDVAKLQKLLFSNQNSLRGLTHLTIGVLEDSDFDCRCLAGLDDVRVMCLSGVRLTCSDFVHLADMENLEMLHICDCEFDVEDSAPLSSAKHLAWMEVSTSFSKSDDVHLLREILPVVYISY